MSGESVDGEPAFDFEMVLAFVYSVTEISR